MIISFDESFSQAKRVGSLLISNDEEARVEGRRLVIDFLDNYAHHPVETHEVWVDLIEAAGFYPYLEKERADLALTGMAGLIRKELHKSESLHGKYFHEEQQYALNIFDTGKNLIISAPTSFGKSLLIEELISRRVYQNIVVVQPTLALLDETRKSLKKYTDTYKILIKTSQSPSGEKGNIFLFTAERVLEYQDFPKIDLLVVDEFYKLSQHRNDDRADLLNIALYRILKNHSPRFYLLGPNIDAISKGFAEKYNAQFVQTNYSLVNAEVTDLYTPNKAILADPEVKRNLLFEFLDHCSGQTMIYCSSPERARALAASYLEHALTANSAETYMSTRALGDWLSQNIHPDWSLIKCLEYGIGVHDGALPRHVGTTIIHLFNRSQLNYLFCTSTLIEGVNTTAKNIVIFDKKRGRSSMDFFDYSNIKGRAGRMMVHYSGNVINFNPVPKREEIIVDIPFFDQDHDTSDEVLVQLSRDDVLDPRNEKYQKILDVPEDERRLFTANAISFWGQKSLLEQLRLDVVDQYEMLNWSNTPTYHQLLYIIELAKNHLAPRGGLGMTTKRMATLANIYANTPNMKQLISQELHYWKTRQEEDLKSRTKSLDQIVREVFQFQRNWLSYTLPKWLYVVNSLQEMACEEAGLEPGNFTIFASRIENDFIKAEFSFLIEMGLPRTAVEKLAPFLAISENEETIVASIPRAARMADLTPYEAQKVTELLT